MTSPVARCSALLLALALLMPASCKGEGEEAPPPAPAERADGERPAEAPPSPSTPEEGAPSLPAEPEGHGLTPDEVAELAVLVAEIDCHVDVHDEPEASQRAVDQALSRAGLSRAAYDERVRKVSGDATFVTVRQRSLEACRAERAAAADAPTVDADAALREKLKVLAVTSECMRRAGTTSEEMAQATIAMYRAHGIDLETYSREMARLANNQQFQAELAAAIAECPEAPEVDDDDPDAVDDDAEVDDEDGDEEPAEEPVKPRPPSIAGTYLGTISGGGSIRIAIAGRNVGATTATIDGVHFRLKGRVGSDNSINLGDTQGNDFVQLRGRIDPSKRTISGTWNGVVKGKKRQGSFSAKR